MERHPLRVLLSVGLLVVLAWLGIALFLMPHAHGVPVVLVVLWAIAVVMVLGFEVRNLMQGRRARLERGSERTIERP